MPPGSRSTASSRNTYGGETIYVTGCTPTSDTFPRKIGRYIHVSTRTASVEMAQGAPKAREGGHASETVSQSPVLRYFIPESQITTATVRPAQVPRRSCNAAATFAPAE